MTKSRIVWLGALMLASTALFASMPDLYPGKFQVAMGKTVYVSLAPEADGGATPTFYRSPPKVGPFISFSLIGGVGGRMLVVTNKYDKDLAYKARVCVSGERLCDSATFEPVKGGITTYKSWGESVYAIEVTALALE